MTTPNDSPKPPRQVLPHMPGDVTSAFREKPHDPPTCPRCGKLGRGMSGITPAGAVCACPAAQATPAEADVQITEGVALALSDLQRASRSVGELAFRDGAQRAEREEAEARVECEREILDTIRTHARGVLAIAESNAEANALACKMLYATRDLMVAIARTSVCAYCGMSAASETAGCEKCPPRLDDITRMGMSAAQATPAEDALARLREENALLRSLAARHFAEVERLRADAERLQREVAPLRTYRDEQEARIRALPVSKMFEQADADYLRVLASYGTRVVRAAWLRDMACRIEATLAAHDAARATDAPEGEAPDAHTAHHAELQAFGATSAEDRAQIEAIRQRRAVGYMGPDWVSVMLADFDAALNGFARLRTELDQVALLAAGEADRV